MTTTTEEKKSDPVIVGPDLNSARAPLDKKAYKQILLPNGLRAVLVSDVAAMNQIQSEGGMFLDDDDDDTDEEDDDGNGDTKMKEEKSPGANDTEEKDDDAGGDEDSEEGEAEASWLRDAACAVTVGVGSFSDPPDCQGLAHFLEHLLFMGSEKYPVENDYDAFMSKHGGAENAFTESETTTYYFSIPQEYLGGALDRLAQFFIAPLMLKSGVDRELKAIESEYQLHKQSDHARLQNLWSTTSGNPNHPFSQFQWGNLKSLKEIPEQENVDPMARLRSFFDKYYYAANTRVVVVGAYTLDDLEKYVVKCFSDVPALPREGPTPPRSAVSWDSVYESDIQKLGLPFAASSFKLYRIVPVKDRHNLSITWQLPPQIKNWKSKPCDYIAHLLGHEAQGSLLSALKKKSWVTTCVAGAGGDGMEGASSHCLFTMTFTLSIEGVDQWQHIISALYSFIGMLRQYGKQLPEWIYSELRSLHDLAYRFADERSPEDLVEGLVEDMAPHLNMPPERLLDGNDLLHEYDPEAIQELLLLFNPRNARIDFMSSTFGRAPDFGSESKPAQQGKVLEPSVQFSREEAGPPQQEPWFGTYYWIEDLDTEMVQGWTDLASPQMPPAELMLSLPPKNSFVPTTFDIKPTPPDDCDHPLLNCSLKFCIGVGKKKHWLPGTITKFNGVTNTILVSYEDEDETWHKVDQKPEDLSRTCDIEGTLDNKAIKFRVVAVPKVGEGAIRKFGDDSDEDVLDGTQYPPIPPAKASSRLPQLIHSTQTMKLWHMQDRDFRRPIAELRVAVFSSRANDSALHRACTELVVQLCHDALTETVYMAALCELGSSIESSEYGFGFRMHGFDDKLLALFEIVFAKLLSFRGRSGEDGLPDGIEEARFDACMEMLQRKYENSGMEAASMGSSVRVRCVCLGSWSSSQKAEATKGLDIPTFVQIASQILEKVGVEALFHGNVDVPGAKVAADLIERMVKSSGGGGLPKKKQYYQFVSKIPPAKEPIIVTLPSKDAESGNTAVEVYFQVGKDNIVDRVVIDMLVHLINEPLYNQLRTKEQFGYRVHCDSRWSVGVMGIKFLVVTAVKSAAATAERIEKFLVDFRADLVAMKSEDYFENLVALAKEKLDMFNSLAEETSCFWSEIRDNRYDWEVNRTEALALRNVTKASVLEAFDKWLNPDVKRRMMVVQVICSPQKSDEEISPASLGRPEVEKAEVGSYCDGRVNEFHQTCKNQTWGKIFT